MALIAWYKLDGDALDSSGNENHLVYQSNNQNIIEAEGKIKKSYEKINASPDHFLSKKTIDLSNQSFTMTCWIYYNSTSTSANGVVTNHQHGSNSGSGITIRKISDTDARISCNTGDGSSRTFNTYFGTTNIMGAWHHLIVRYDTKNKNLSLWVNGEKEYERTYAMYCKEDKIGLFKWSLGNSSSGYLPPMNLDDVRIYNHALSTKEIKELARAKVLHYTFDNPESEPTENLIENPLLLNNAESWNRRNTEVENYENFTRVTSMDTHDGISQTNSMVVDKIYVRSYWYKHISGAPVIGGHLSNADSQEIRVDGSGWISDNKIDVPNDGNFHFIEQRFVATSTSGAHWLQPARGVNEITTGDFWTDGVRGIQMEEKAYSTPFTPSIREGKVKDVSGYDNHAELALDTTPQWIENSKIGIGAYKFNGNSILETNQLFYDHENQQWTALAWFLIPDTSFRQTFNNFNNNNNIVHSGSRALLYLNGGVNDSYVYSGPIPEGKWFHIAYVVDTNKQRCDIYIDGVLNRSSINYSESDTPSGFSNKTIFGEELQGIMDDVRIYATDLSSDDIKAIYQSRGSLDSQGNLSVSNINQHISDYVTASQWARKVGNPFNIYTDGVKTYSEDYIYNDDVTWDTSQWIEYDFWVKETGDYTIKAFIHAPDGQHDSFFMAINEEAFDDWHTGQNADWFWSTWTTKTLERGNHILKVAPRESTKASVFSIKKQNVSANQIFKNDITSKGILNGNDISTVGIVDDIQAWYPLNGNTKDVAGDKHHGTNNGATIVNGHDGQLAYEFNGESDITINNFNKIADREEFTISFWAYISVSSGYIFWRNTGILLEARSSNYRFRVNLDGDWRSNHYLGYPLNEWHHVTVSWDGTYTKMYLNGDKQVDSMIDSDYSKTSNTTNDLLLGHRAAIYDGLTGKMQDVRIFNRALSSEEISILYNMTGGSNSKMKMTKEMIYLKGDVKEV